MAKEKQKPYEFLSNLVLALMGTDRIFSNSFFSSEFAISPNTLSEIRRGEDMCIYQYVINSKTICKNFTNHFALFLILLTQNEMSI